MSAAQLAADRLAAQMSISQMQGILDRQAGYLRNPERRALHLGMRALRSFLARTSTEEEQFYSD